MINVCSVASNKMVGLVHARRWKKKKKKEIDSFLLMRSSMNLSQFLNEEFFIKYITFLELAKMYVSNIYIGSIRTFLSEIYYF